MNHWKRISIAIIVLIGGTAVFGYWATHEFSSALGSIDGVRLVTAPIVTKPETQFATTTETSDSTIATSTFAGSSTPETVTPLATTSPTVETFDPATFALTFPEKNATLYPGCTYTLTWNGMRDLTSLKLWIVQADTIEKVHPSVSGLVGTSTAGFHGILPWTLGNVTDGIYYILISNINGVDMTYRSERFAISTATSTGVDDICAR